MKRDFISVADWSADELLELLARARELKRLLKAGERPQTLLGRTVALYFEKPSLRTHVTFEAGVAQMGGHAILLRPEQVGIGTRESPRDVARNLSCWVDALMTRTYSHELIQQLAREAIVPVINGLSDFLHPCQAMADLQTIAEKVEPKSAVIAYVGDGNNVANSLILLSATLGLALRVATPVSHRPSNRVWQQAEAIASRSGAQIAWTEDPVEAVRGADFVYTDTWTSMGQESEAELRREIFARYQVNAGLLAGAPDAWILHCLPAHRGEEITDEILDGPRSLILDQAENRLHAQKAILERVILGSSSGAE
ncbi:MAG: ornithine carbamoyltransferase [Proteobacteria bacterium]|nr:ornithine carbamoyltransferase [Pseudomonadota bacterium]